MDMKAIILTDDTSSQLPTHNKWSNRFGIGSIISKNPSIINIFKKEKIELPSNDYENEERYKQILHDFVRPARNMFGGRFSEIRYFEEELKKIASVETFIISGRYGLLEGDTEIIPYYFSIKTITQLKTYDKEHHFLEKLISVIPGTTHLIILLPKIYVEYFIKQCFFDRISQKIKIIVVSSKEFDVELKKYANVTLLERKGVSRLRNQNCDKILAIFQDNKSQS